MIFLDLPVSPQKYIDVKFVKDFIINFEKRRSTFVMQSLVLFTAYIICMIFINFTAHHVLFSTLHAIYYLEIMSLFLFSYIVDVAGANRGIF